MRPDDLRTRVATGARDAQTLAVLRREWNGAVGDPGFEKRLADWLREEGDRRTVWLLERAGEAIGMGTMLEYRRMPLPGEADGAWGYIGSMFVREQHRGGGAGAQLLAAMIAESERRGYVRVILSPSPRAVPFYKRAGFVEPDGVAGDRLLVRRSPHR